jgi:foldase protein PrsA
MSFAKARKNFAKKVKAFRRTVYKRKNRRRLLIVSGVTTALILIGTVYFKFFVAAVVNGRIIARSSVVKPLEAQGGAQVLDDLITKELIFQEAKKRKIIVTQEEINQEIENVKSLVESQGATLDEALRLQGQTKESFVELLRVQKIVEKLFEKELKVTKTEITSYFEENKASFGEDAELTSDLQEQVRKRLRQEKLTNNFQEWVAELRQKANIKRFVGY